MREGRHIRAIGDGTQGGVTGDPADGYAADPEMTAETAPPVWEEFVEEPAPQRRIWPTALGIGAVLAILAWTAFFGWTNRAAMIAGAAPGQWIAWIAQWAMPVLLVAVAWLIAMRSSTREAARFGDAARMLSQESALLETRLSAVNRELSLAREFLAAQSRELDYVGRAAAEKISEHAASLQALVIDNGAQVDAIAGVSATALENMAQLRDNLPVIANSARDVTNQIGGAGNTARGQLDELIAGFERLNEFGQASERQVISLRERIDTVLGSLNALVADMDADNAARFAALRGESEDLRAALEAREAAAFETMRRRGEALRDELVASQDARQLEEAAALAAMRGRIAAFTRDAHDAAAAVRTGERVALDAWEAQVVALRQRLEQALAEVGTLDRQFLDKAREKLAQLSTEAEAVDRRLTERDQGFQQRVADRQAAFDQAETAAFARLEERAGALDAELARRHAHQEAMVRSIGDHGDALAARVAEIEAQVASVATRSGEAERTLAAGSDRFAETVFANAQQLAETEQAVARLTDASVRLLELIQAAASHSRTELPTAIGGFEAQLGAARESSGDIRATLDEARRLGAEIEASLATMRDETADRAAAVEALRGELARTGTEQGEALSAVSDRLAAIGDQNRSLAQEVSDRLAAAIGQLQQASAGVIDNLEGGQAERVAALAARIGEDSAHAIDRAIAARTEQTVAQLDEATARSAEVSQEAVAALRDQLARVHELTVNLETRAARAREQVEEQVDSDFARRMALIVESLNSHSIDIAKALSTEVTDTAWASYLKGDRGVFTRRAVRLVDGGEAREISQLYENDHEFRDHVSRYIHDFEAMLRTMLSTRDGHALGVTLLSSDMGKLYVAMAQAIQRLRQ